MKSSKGVFSSEEDSVTDEVWLVAREVSEETNEVVACSALTHLIDFPDMQIPRIEKVAIKLKIANFILPIVLFPFKNLLENKWGFFFIPFISFNVLRKHIAKLFISNWFFY